MKKRLLKNAVAILALTAMLTQNLYSGIAVMADELPEFETEISEPEIEVETVDYDAQVEEPKETPEEQPAEAPEEQQGEEISEETPDEQAPDESDEATATDEENIPPANDENYDDQSEPLDDLGLGAPVDETPAEGDYADIPESVEIFDSQISGSGVDSIEVMIDTSEMNQTDKFEINFTGPDSATYDAIVNDVLDAAAGGIYVFSNLNKEGFNIRVTSEDNVNIEYLTYDGIPTIKIISLGDNDTKLLQIKTLTEKEGSPISVIYSEGYDKIELTFDTKDLADNVAYDLCIETKADAAVNGDPASSRIKNLGKDAENIVIDNLDGKALTAYVKANNIYDLSSVISVENEEDGIVKIAVSGEEIRNKKQYTYSDSHVDVTATLEYAEAVPDNAEFVVTPITEGPAYEVYMEALKAKSNDEIEYTEENTLLYDVAFLVDKKDEEGNVIEGEKVEFEPELGSVNIEIKFKRSQLSEDLGADSNEEVIINHIPLNEDVKKNIDKAIDAVDITVNDVTVEEVAAEADVESKTDSVEFSLDSLSTITVTVANDGKLDVTADTAHDYDYLSILGNAVNYGITTNVLNHGAHMDTNFAAGKLTGNAQITGGKYTGGGNPGNLIIGEYTGSGFYTDCGNNPFIIYTTEDVKSKLALNNMYDKCKSIVIDTTSFTEAELKQQVSDMVSGTRSDELYGVDSYIGWVDKIYNKDNQKYWLDLTDANKYPLGTYYFTFDEGEYGSTVGSQADKFHIAIRDGQRVVFNIPDDSVTIQKFSIKIVGKNNDNEITSSTSDSSADPYTKAVIWNCNPASYVNCEAMLGVVLAPNADAEIGTTSTGWLVCNKMIRNAGEWHGTWKEMPRSFPDSTQFAVRKKLENNGTEKPAFEFKLFLTKSQYYTDSEFRDSNPDVWPRANKYIETVTIKSEDYDANYIGVKTFSKVVYNDSYIDTYKKYATINNNKYTFHYVIREMTDTNWAEYPEGGYQYIAVTVQKTVSGSITRYEVKSIVTAEDVHKNIWGVRKLKDPKPETTIPPVLSFTNIKKGHAEPGQYIFTATKSFKNNNWPAGKTFTLRLVSMSHDDDETHNYDNWISNYNESKNYSGYGPLPSEEYVIATEGLSPVYDQNGKYCGVDCVVSASNPVANFGTAYFPYDTPTGERDEACDSSIAHGVRCRCYLYKIYELNDDNKDIVPPEYVTGPVEYTKDGVTYDPKLQRVKLWINQQRPSWTNQKVTIIVNGSTGGTQCEGSLVDIGYTNDYSAQGDGTVKVLKNLEGRNPVDGEFTVKISRESWVDNGISKSKYAMPLPADYNDNTGVVNTGSIFQFGKIAFTSEGEYVYKLTEVNKNDTETSKVTYSDQNIYVKYVVTDNHAGDLEVTGPTYYDSLADLNNGVLSEKQDAAEFKNKFEPEKEVGFSLSKYLDDAEVSNANTNTNGFEFEIYSPAGDHNDPKYSRNTKSTKNGSNISSVLEFAKRKYKVSDLGENYAAKEYYYIIKETGAYSGYVTDQTKYRVTVKVSLNGTVFNAEKIKVEKTITGDDNGTEGWETVASDSAALTYVPKLYNYKKGNESISVHKIFEKDPSRTFTFTFKDLSNASDQGTDVNTVNGIASYNTRNFTLKDVGSTFSYSVQEKLPSGITTSSEGVVDKGNDKYKYQGVVYDLKVYTMVVVPENHNGTIGFKKYRESVAENNILAGSLDITNDYEVTQTSAHLEANKLYNNAAYTEDVAATKGTFYFTVKEVFRDDSEQKNVTGRTLIETVAANPAKTASGNNIIFADMPYTSTGDHEYEIYESTSDGTPVSSSSQGDIDYDTTVYTATISVSDQNGQLVATSPVYSIGGTAIETGTVPKFNNSDKTGAKIDVQKYLRARDGSTLETRTGMRSLLDKEFTFELYNAKQNSDGKYVIDGDRIGEPQKNDGNGQLSFDLPKYSKSQLNVDSSGNYQPTVFPYIVKEVSTINNTVAEYAEQLVTVKVTYTGQMNTEVTYYDPETGSAKTGSSADDKKVVFINKWGADAYAPMSGTKTFIGSKIPDNDTFKVGIYREADKPTNENLNKENPVTPIYRMPVIKNGVFSKDRDGGTFRITEATIKDESVNDLHFTEKDAGKQYTFWLREIKGTDNIKYDDSIVKVTVDVKFQSTDNSIYTVVKYYDSANNPISTITHHNGDNDATSAVAVENTDKTKVDVSLQGKKELVGRDYNDITLGLNGRTYTFYLLKDDTAHTEITHKSNNSAGNISFTNQDTNELEYTVERLGSEASKPFAYYIAEEGYNNPVSVTEDGVTYLRNIFRVEIDVKINEESGKVEKGDPKYYRVDSSWNKVGSALTAANVVFKNPYKADGSFEINVDKTLVGRDVKADDEFTFEIYDLNAADNATPSTFTIKAEEKDGKIVLPETTVTVAKYTEADLDSDGTAYKYYKIKEAAAPDGSGITIGGEIYIIKVKLTDNNSGTINATEDEKRNVEKESEPQTIASKIKEFFTKIGEIFTGSKYTFKNTYNAKGKIRFAATKIFNPINGNDAVNRRSFTFELLEQKDSGDPISVCEPVTINRNADNSWSDVYFDEIEYTNLTETFDSNGVSKHTYILREVDEHTDNDVVHYDDTEYTIHVDVRDANNGHLTVSATYDNSKTGETGITLNTVSTETAPAETEAETQEDAENTNAETGTGEGEGETESTADTDGAAATDDTYVFETLSFTNWYESSDYVQFGGTKTCENFGDAAVGTYEVTVTGFDKNDNPVAGYRKDDLTYMDEDASVSGNVLKQYINGNENYTLPKIYYTKDDVENSPYHYTVKETKGVIGDDVHDNIIYDTTEYTVDVTVSFDETTGAVVAEASDNRNSLNFTNTYIREGGLSIPAAKKYNYDTTVIGSYTFALEEINRDGSAKTDRMSKVTATANNTSVITFNTSDYKFTNADINKDFYFKAYETNPDSGEAITENNKVIGGTTYDTTQFFVKVHVGEGSNTNAATGKGELDISYEYYKSLGDMQNGTNKITPSTGQKAITFNNTYSTVGAIDITGVKVMNDDGIKLSDAGNIKIELRAGSENGELLGTATVKATEDYKGTFKFSGKDEDRVAAESDASIVYSEALKYNGSMLGSDGTAQKIYYMKEIIPIDSERNAGITYDEVIYKIVVNLSDENHNGVISTGKTIVCVKDSQNSDIKITSTIKEPLLFKNIYDAKGFWDPAGIKKLEGLRSLSSGEFKFTITEKKFTDREGKNKLSLLDSLFSTHHATVTNGEVNSETGYALVKFDHNADDIKNIKNFLNYGLDAEGIHVYEIKEEVSKISGVTDSKAVYTVTVDVHDNGNGTMVPTILKVENNADTTADELALLVTDKENINDNRPFAFINKFEASGYIDLIGVKSMEGRKLGEHEKFKFWIEDEKGNREYVESDGSAIEFEHINPKLEKMLTFDQPGEHKYTITEDRETGKPGVTADTSKYVVTVVVEHVYDSNNKPTNELQASVKKPVLKYFDGESEVGEKLYSAVKADSELFKDNKYRFIDVFFFKNEYTAKVNASLEGLKHVKYAEEGPDIFTVSMLDGQYRFLLYKYDTEADRLSDNTNNRSSVADVYCGADGKYRLSIPEFTQGDLYDSITGTYADSKTLYYRVYEWNPIYKGNHADKTSVESDGIKYDVKEYNINVTISASDDSEELKISVVDADTGNELTKSGADGKYTFGSLDYTNVVNRITKISGEKHWIDNVTDASSRPKVTVRLYANGVETAKTEIVAPETKYVFNNLPVVDRYGKDIVYTVAEDSVEGYESERNGYDFYNTKGEIKIRKVDETTGDTLVGAELMILDKSAAVIESWTSDVSAHVVQTTLTPGAEYILRETKAPEGYAIAEDIGFTAPKRGGEITITMNDRRITGVARLTKRDADTREALSGAEFALYRDDGTRVYATGKKGAYTYTTLTSNGIFEVDSSGELRIEGLPYGTYYFKEVKAPVGYELSAEKYPFSIINADVTVDTTVVDPKVLGTVTLRKTNADGSRSLPGAEFELYAKTPNSASAAIASTIYKDVYYKVGTYTTDSNGRIYVTDLPWDSYYFVETKAPTGYKINRDTNGSPLVYTFTVDGSTGVRDLVYDLGSITNAAEEPETPPETPTTPTPTTPTTPPVATTPPVLGERTTPTPAVDSGRRLGGVLSDVLGVRAAPESGVLGERVGPVTGDASNMVLWLLLLVFCVSMIVAMVIKSKRRTNQIIDEKRRRRRRLV